MAYVPQPFPKMLYLDGQNVVVTNAGAEIDARRAGWGDTPDWTMAMAVAALDAPAPEPEPAPEPPSLPLEPVAVEPEPEPEPAPVVPVAAPEPPVRTFGKGRRR